jgi:hypothetical protein
VKWLGTREKNSRVSQPLGGARNLARARHAMRLRVAGFVLE